MGKFDKAIPAKPVAATDYPQDSLLAYWAAAPEFVAQFAPNWVKLALTKSKLLH